MKKIRLFLLVSAFCIFSVPHTALASEEAVPAQNAASQNAVQDIQSSQDVLLESEGGTYETAGALWQAWQAGCQKDESPYPDYICGVWSTDGTVSNLTFAVTKDEAGEAGKNEILEWVKDDSTVSFTYQTYPYYELLEIQLALKERLGDETGAYGIGIYEDKNYVCIDMDSSNENSEAFMRECFQKYSDRICFEIGNENINATQDGFYLDKGKNGRAFDEEGGKALPWSWIACVGILALCGTVFLARTRFLAVMQTTKGSVSVLPSLTKKQTIDAIKKNTAEPNPMTFQSIMEKIEEEK